MSALPLRTSRGKRFRRVLADEHDADEEFWGQEFFKEDEKDDPYLTESSKESVADSDFDDAESQKEQNSEIDEPLEKPRKKRLLPPGSLPRKSKATVKRPKEIVKKDVPIQPSIKTEVKDEEHEGTAVELRKSTLLRRTVAEEERRLQELHRVRRPRTIHIAPTMQLEEFLKEAAEVESANLASLNELRAFEEASKKRAIQTRKRSRCPSVTIRSKRSGDVERTTLDLTNATRLPKWLRRQPRPKPVVAQKCVVTGLPAKYRDPVTKLPYATIEAFRKIRESMSTQQ